MELLCKHIPDRYEHLVRYVGWYSNHTRNERAKSARLLAGVAQHSPGEESAIEFAGGAKAAWARLIRKIYAADSPQCSECKGPMRVIALIEDPGVIRRILEHLGLWAPQAMERSPPLDPASYAQSGTSSAPAPGASARRTGIAAGLNFLSLAVFRRGESG